MSWCSRRLGSLFGQSWVLPVLLLEYLCPRCRGLYDPVRKLESARLYGNIDAYAYYFVDLIVGTPPQRVSVILDTGSGVTAFPCKGCAHCGRHIDPLFDVSSSSSASWLPCKSCPGTCQSQRCTYRQGYTEGSSISGNYFADMVRLGDAIQRNPPVKTTLGCHSNENKLFFTQKANGIMGIRPPSPGQATLLQRLFDDRSHVDTAIFSICLAEWGGLFTVGGYNESLHTTSIAFVPMSPGTSFYKVPLKSMRINGHEITNFRSSMIDSGTTYTYMSTACYRSLLDNLVKYCDSHGTSSGSSCGATRRGSTCWEAAKGLNAFPDIDVMIGGYLTKWVPNAYLYRKGTGHTWCVTFMNDGANANTVLGASWMVHQDIVFDVRNRKIGIASAKCPSYRERPSHDTRNIEPPVAAPPLRPVVQPVVQPPAPKTETTGGRGAVQPVEASNTQPAAPVALQPAAPVASQPAAPVASQPLTETTATEPAHDEEPPKFVDSTRDRLFRPMGASRWAAPAAVVTGVMLACIALVWRRCTSAEKKGSKVAPTRDAKTVVGSVETLGDDEEDQLVIAARRTPVATENVRPEVTSSATSTFQA